jgi:hypothetical protein
VVEYSVTLSALKTPAKIGSAIPVNFQVKNAGVVISDLSIVLLIESVFNGSVPSTGCVASPNGTHEILYRSPNFSTGKSSLRFVTSLQSDQFNWDSTSAQTDFSPTDGVNDATGPGCYSVLIYLNDRGLPPANPRVSGPVELRN